MKKRVLRSLALLTYLCLAACSTHPNQPQVTYAELPQVSLMEFTYMDGLNTAKKINCASSAPTDCMACALQGEAADQNGKGIYAVGVTIMTRAKGDINKICKVTKARRQFEGMRSKGEIKISEKVWTITNFIIESRETGGTHFWSPKIQYKLNRGKPSWAYKFEKRKCRKTVIDDHVFFNTNDCKYDRYMRLIGINEIVSAPVHIGSTP